MSGVPESPFDTTIFNNPPLRQTLLGLIRSAYVPGRDTKFGAMRSRAQMGITAAYSIKHADQRFCDDAVKAVLRERRACAEIASRFSTEATSEILSRPLPTAEKAS